MKKPYWKRARCLVLAVLMLTGMVGCGGVRNEAPDGPPVESGVQDMPAYGRDGTNGMEQPGIPSGTEDPEEPAGTEDPEAPAGTDGPEIKAGAEDPEEPAETKMPDGPAEIPGPPETPEPDPEPDGHMDPAETAGPNPVVSAVNPIWFEDSLSIYFREECGMADKSYMVSPASFRAALCLAVEGSRDDTRDGLLQAAGFESYDEMVRWYQDLLNAKAEFEQARAVMDEDKARYENDPNGTGMAFHIANAVWDNLGFDGGFRDGYVQAVWDKYQATAGMSSADRITDDVNSWCEENTGGMIKSIASDLSQTRAVLANALYIKSGWSKPFGEHDTSMDKFVMADGSTADLEFMCQTDDFRYAEDPNGKQYAAFHLYGDVWFQVCLDTDIRPNDFFSALYRQDWELLDVKMPKLDLETTLGEGMLNRYLIMQGADLAFSDMADFSDMTDRDGGWHIDDVIQKTRLKTDEDGLEAAAVTAITMVGNAMIETDPPQPIPFYMDRPFSFLITKGIYGSDSDPVILFFGQYTGQ